VKIKKSKTLGSFFDFFPINTSKICRSELTGPQFLAGIRKSQNSGLGPIQ
jgi:hypothetical protein